METCGIIAANPRIGKNGMVRTVKQEVQDENGNSKQASRAGIFKKSMGARHRVGIGLSYRPARLHGLAELMPWNRFLSSINV